MKPFLRTLAAVGCLFAATSVLAQDYVVLDQRADEFDRWQDRVDDSYGPVTIISRETNVPVDVLVEQRSRTHFGYGGLMIGNAIAEESGRSFDEIAALRASGRGWGDIAREYGVRVDPVVGRFERADTAYRGGNFKRDEMKAAKFVNGHDARDGKLDGTGPKHSRGRFTKVKGKGNGKAKGGGGHGHGNGGGHGNGHGGGKGKK